MTFSPTPPQLGKSIASATARGGRAARLENNSRALPQVGNMCGLEDWEWTSNLVVLNLQSFNGPTVPPFQQVVFSEIRHCCFVYNTCKQPTSRKQFVRDRLK